MQPVQIDKEKILICIKDNMTQADMAKKFYCTPNVVHRHLDELIKEGCIYREGRKLKISESPTDKTEIKPKKKTTSIKIEESINRNTDNFKEEKITPALTINLGPITENSKKGITDSSTEYNKIQKTENVEQKRELRDDIEAVVKCKCGPSKYNDEKLNLAIQNAMKDGKRAMEAGTDNKFSMAAPDKIERKNSEAELKVQKHEIDNDCKLIIESLKSTGADKKTIERAYNIAAYSDENDSDKVKNAFKDLIFTIVEQEIKL